MLHAMVDHRKDTVERQKSQLTNFVPWLTVAWHGRLTLCYWRPHAILRSTMFFLVYCKYAHFILELLYFSILEYIIIASHFHRCEDRKKNPFQFEYHYLLATTLECHWT